MENIYFEIKSKQYLRIMLQHSITKINIAIDLIQSSAMTGMKVRL